MGSALAAYVRKSLSRKRPLTTQSCRLERPVNPGSEPRRGTSGWPQERTLAPRAKAAIHDGRFGKGPPGSSRPIAALQSSRRQRAQVAADQADRPRRRPATSFDQEPPMIVPSVTPLAVRVRRQRPTWTDMPSRPESRAASAFRYALAEMPHFPEISSSMVGLHALKPPKRPKRKMRAK